MKRFFYRLQKNNKVLFPIGVFLFFLVLISGLKELQKGRVVKIGVIPVENIIYSTKPFLQQIDAFWRDEQIDIIVLKINSPGGAVAPVQELFQKLLLVRERKPIYTSVSTLAASGGYYLASASDKIFANKGSTLGSIGVIFQYIRYGGLLKKIGVAPVTIKSGKHKDIISPFREPSVKERNLIQEIVDESHQQFIADIALGRGVKKNKIAPLADGRIFSGSQAKTFGLIDEIGGMEQLLDYIKVKHQFQKIELVYPQKNWGNYWENFRLSLGFNQSLQHLQLSGLLAIYAF